MVFSAVWLQAFETLSSYTMWLTIFVGILALALLLQAIFVAIFLGKVTTLITDLKRSFDETKGKALPLMADVKEIAQSTQVILRDLTPKIKVVSENVVETSHTVRAAAETVRQTIDSVRGTVQDTTEKAAVTFADANVRAQKQVARVDGMVASTLAATAEIGQTIYHGIRVPARKIAEITTQSKHMLETLIDRAKALGIGVGHVVQGKTDPKKPKPGW